MAVKTKPTRKSARPVATTVYRRVSVGSVQESRAPDADPVAVAAMRLIDSDVAAAPAEDADASVDYTFTGEYGTTFAVTVTFGG